MKNGRRTAMVLLLLVSGCGSCQQGREMPAASSDETRVAPMQPPVAEEAAATPQPRVEGGLVATPMLPPVGAAPAAPGAAGAEEEDCIVIIDADPDYGPPPLTVAFSAEAECFSGQPTYSWDFGDGSPAGHEVNPTHQYTQVGDYIASVTATGPSGATATDEIDITVEED